MRVRWHRGLVPLGILAFCAAGPGVARAHFESDQDTVEVVSANVGGKNVFIPGTIVLVAGKPHTLSLFNTTDVPHGFSIPGIGVEEVLPPGEEVKRELPALEGGHVYRVDCHLHPPHRSATLVVLPAKSEK